MTNATQSGELIFIGFIQYSSAMGQSNVCLNVTVSGDVQGVGFRPRVKRLADQLGVTGWVRNECDRVRLHLQADASDIKTFLAELRNRIPDLQWQEEVASYSEYADFSIADSVTQPADTMLQVPADKGICAACLQEYHDPANRRFHYALISCHDCGPRYSILKQMPFAREHSAFARWQPCCRCQAEFSDSADRRFHSELICCPDCGPQLQLIGPICSPLSDARALIQQAVACLQDGGILALKSQTGMQLLCRADDVHVVMRLRRLKQRPRKPLALLVANVAMAEKFSHIAEGERVLLASPPRPIVLLSKRSDSSVVLAENIAEEMPDWGVLLPVSGLHVALLEGVGQPLVCTSANISGEPLLFKNDDILSCLNTMCDLALVHDIEIYLPQDDSVVMQSTDRNMVLRRGRGYAHQRLDLPAKVSQLGLGGDLKHAFALARHDSLVLGPHIGDCETVATQQRQQLLLRRLTKMHEFTAERLATDQHPGYTTCRQATAMSEVQVCGVQHHLAHVMTNHALCKLPQRYLALAWDGNGWGADGSSWGSEVFLVEQGIPRRVAALTPFSLPGGEQAARQPWRMALSLCFHGGMSLARAHELLLNADIEFHAVKAVWRLLERSINSPASQAMGRLFDGVSHVLTGCSAQQFEGDAAIRLQALANKGAGQSHRFIIETRNCGELLRGDWQSAWHALLLARQAGIEAAELALGFHQGLVQWALDLARYFEVGALSVSGGCFQNRLLQSLLLQQEADTGITVYWPATVPVNDGGLAIGQLWCIERGLNIPA